MCLGMTPSLCSLAAFVTSVASWGAREPGVAGVIFNMKKIQSEDLFVLTGDAIGLSMEMKSQAVHTE